MRYYFLKCKDCLSEVEVYCDGENAMLCPECLNVDCFEEIEGAQDETSK